MPATELTRRTFLKGAAVVGAMIPMGSLLAACGGSDTTAETSTASEAEIETTAEATPSVETDETTDPANATVGGSVLVAYYSATGNTQSVAQAIVVATGADEFAITPVEPYSSEDLGYNNENSRTSIERNDPNRHVELTAVTPEGFTNYDTVFLGYPIWWGDASWVVDDFVAENDFTGKTVIPFCTSGSSPIGSSAEDLAALAGTGDWLEGRRFSGGASESEIAAWLEELGL